MNSEPKRSSIVAGVGSRMFRAETPAGVDLPGTATAGSDLPDAGVADLDLPRGRAAAARTDTQPGNATTTNADTHRADGTATNGNTHPGSATATNGDTNREDAPSNGNTHRGGGSVVDLPGRGAARSDGVAEWAALGEWFASPPLLRDVDLGVLRERLAFVGRARSRLAALEADVVGEISRREGAAGAEEILRQDQKRSRSGARRAVKVAAQLDWAPQVADKLADGAITPEAAGLILDAGGDTPVNQRTLLDAAEVEADDQFRRTLKQHVNELTSEQELQERRERQRRRRRASIREQSDGMFHLFAQLDPLTGNRVRAAVDAKSDELFRQEDAKNRATAPQRLADALAELICDSDGAGVGAPAGAELIVLADYDVVNERIDNGRLPDGTRLTEAETLAAACDARILPGIFNKHTNSPLLGRAQRKIPKRLHKQLVARDGGCIGCGAHHRICQVHHIKHWAHGGQTTLENTCLVCWRCHHVRIHEHGEEITRHPRGKLSLAPPGTPGAASPQRPPPHHRHRRPTEPQQTLRCS